MRVRIFQPAKTAMQSGRARTRQWVLEPEPSARRDVEPLMGWTSSRDTGQQVRLTFGTVEEAVAFAERQGWAYAVERPDPPKRRPKSYADNFRFDRLEPWTH
jgi:hypothetical protein